jgi:hypothetical protein
MCPGRGRVVDGLNRLEDQHRETVLYVLNQGLELYGGQEPCPLCVWTEGTDRA